MNVLWIQLPRRVAVWRGKPGGPAIQIFRRSWEFDFFKDYLFIYLFVERGREGEERERHINVWLPLMRPLLGTWPETQARALTGNRTGNPLVHRPALNPLSYTSQGDV